MSTVVRRATSVAPASLSWSSSCLRRLTGPCRSRLLTTPTRDSAGPPGVPSRCPRPEPRPDWVVTEDAAIDTELGILKTGKEADVFLVERAVPGRDGAVMAAKRYRSEEHRSFHRSAYTEGRRTRRSRDARALARRPHTAGPSPPANGPRRSSARCRSCGQPMCELPYPVQLDGTDSSWLITVDGVAAPGSRRCDGAELLRDYFAQLSDAMADLARAGWAHGDLSAYNILAAGDRLVIIDLPQLVDIVGNPHGIELLQRDCRNVCSWFRSRGSGCRRGQLFGGLLAQAF